MIFCKTSVELGSLRNLHLKPRITCIFCLVCLDFNTLDYTLGKYRRFTTPINTVLSDLCFSVYSYPQTPYEERIIVIFVSQIIKLKDDVYIAHLRPSSLFCSYTFLNRVGFQTEV